MNPLLSYLPFLACGISVATLWKCFTEVERISKAPFRRQIAQAIMASSIFTFGKILPTLFISAFDTIFTDALWSRRGFVRSCIASLVIVTILALVWYLSIPDAWRVRFVDLGRAGNPESRTWTLIAIRHYTNVPFNLDIDAEGRLHPIPGDIVGNQGGTIGFPTSIETGISVFGGLPIIYNVLVDFSALIVTRRVLRHMATATVWRMIITLCGSVCALLVLSFAALNIAVLMLTYIFFHSTPREVIFTPSRFARAILFPFYTSHPLEWQVDTLYGVFVWSTLVGILWLAIFSAAVIIANVSMKLRGVGPWLSRNFQVQRQPLRILRALVIVVLCGLCAIYHLLLLFL
jgi:hypothetical protein